MRFSSGMHEPQFVPALSFAPISGAERAPALIAAKIRPCGTPKQAQTFGPSSAAPSSLLPDRMMRRVVRSIVSACHDSAKTFPFERGAGPRQKHGARETAFADIGEAVKPRGWRPHSARFQPDRPQLRAAPRQSRRRFPQVVDPRRIAAGNGAPGPSAVTRQLEARAGEHETRQVHRLGCDGDGGRLEIGLARKRIDDGVDKRSRPRVARGLVVPMQSARKTPARLLVWRDDDPVDCAAMVIAESCEPPRP